MAVELAKVSLWLHSFTVGAPLSFLDHHLRCGNSLIGTTAKEAEANMRQEASGQLNLLTGPFVGLLKAAEIMRGVSILSDATFAEVEESERLFRAFDQAAQPYKRLLDIYVAQYFGVKQAKSFLQRFGTDAITADPKKMKKSDRQVYEDAAKVSEEKLFFHWDLEFPEVFIDLEKSGWDENGGFDIVMGNPPYVNAMQLKRYLSSFEKLYWKTQFNSAHGAYDLYILFLEQGNNLAKKHGILSMITPNKFLSAPYAKSFREYMIDHSQLLRLLDVSSVPVFSEPSVYPVVLTLLTKIPDQEYSITIELRSSDQENTTIIQQKSSDLNKFPDLIWGFLVSHHLELALKIEQVSIRLGEISVVYASSTAGEADHYSQALIDHQTKNSIKFINTGLIDRWSVLWGLESLTHQRLQFLTPYLDMNNLVVSDKRKIQYQTPKIIVSKIAKQPEIFWDAAGEYASANTNFVYDSDYSLGYLSTILNSNLIAFIYKIYFGSLEMSGGYAQFQAPQLKIIPIRQIDFTTTKKRRQTAVKKLISLYEKYQKDDKVSPLLAQVNNHLTEEPEEADIIHDFLAYLAEQMIELNKQKQTEMTGFFTWLERFIGCSIDQLTNKSKIQNYLGDYYHDEPHLTFDEMIDIFKKNQKNLKIYAATRKEQQTLEKEYQASLDNLLPIKIQLKQCDHLIDQVVYQLYGLTESEIAIIEGEASIAK